MVFTFSLADLLGLFGAFAVVILWLEARHSDAKKHAEALMEKVATSSKASLDSEVARLNNETAKINLRLSEKAEKLASLELRLAQEAREYPKKSELRTLVEDIVAPLRQDLMWFRTWMSHVSDGRALPPVWADPSKKTGG